MLVWLISVILLTAPRLAAAEQDQLASIRGSIIALDSARRTALQELEKLSPGSGEASDYKDFIAYLNTRIVTYCRDLAKLGSGTGPEELPCPAGPLAAGFVAAPTAEADQPFSSAGPEGAEARTQAEKTAALEGNFLASLGDFDDMLLQEEEKVSARVPSQREASTSGQAGKNGGEGAPGGTEAADTASGTGTTGGSEAQGNQSSSGAETQGGDGASGGIQDPSAYGVSGGTLPPPKDDDIVARQLREAAEKETDPELKKKLWEEYWKYKGRKT
jgi:hypothetical protein